MLTFELDDYDEIELEIREAYQETLDNEVVDREREEKEL